MHFLLFSPVPINDYVVSLEYAADIIGAQLLFNFINIILVRISSIALELRRFSF
jgi:hypothetical protein